MMKIPEIVAVDLLPLDHDAYLPYYATSYSAGADLALCEDAVIPSKHAYIADTKIAVAIPPGFVGLLFVRSSLAFKHGIRLVNSVGVIDADYRGSIQVGLYNDSIIDVLLRKGERIAQLVLVPAPQARFFLVDELPPSARGTGGIGSTGTAHTAAGADAAGPQYPSAGGNDAMIATSAHHEEQRLSAPDQFVLNVRNALDELERDEAPQADATDPVAPAAD